MCCLRPRLQMMAFCFQRVGLSIPAPFPSVPQLPDPASEALTASGRNSRQCADNLTRGMDVTRYSLNPQQNRALVKLAGSLKDKTLFCYSRAKVKSPAVIVPFSSIASVQIGCCSAVFLSSHSASVNPDCCLTIVGKIISSVSNFFAISWFASS